ncbi:MAG: hypothetical protein M5U09_18250 [Gammaproteobacteria bacterium]|nr:hypothetical protein [Gammaproteobacteria bacterium]
MSRRFAWLTMGWVIVTQVAGHGRVLDRAAQDTLTAVELYRGDTLRFTLRNGEVRTFELLETDADVLLTNQPALRQEAKGGTQTIYQFTCRLLADGQPVTLQRYVACQEAFYEPYVINGVRLWFDAVADIFELIRDTHGGCAPAAHARFALCDAGDRICPGRVPLPCPAAGERLDIAETYPTATTAGWGLTTASMLTAASTSTCRPAHRTGRPSRSMTTGSSTASPRATTTTVGVASTAGRMATSGSGRTTTSHSCWCLNTSPSHGVSITPPPRASTRGITTMPTTSSASGRPARMTTSCSTHGSSSGRRSRIAAPPWASRRHGWPRSLRPRPDRRSGSKPTTVSRDLDLW